MKFPAAFPAFWLFQTLLTFALGFFAYKSFKGFRRSSSQLSEKLVDFQGKLRFADEEKERGMAVIESMVEGVVVIDSDQKILLINSVLSQAFDLKRNEIQGRLFWEVFRDPRLNEMIEKSLKSRLPAGLEHSILLSNSVFQIQVSPVFKGEEFLGVTAVFHDVTKLKELERLRSDFVANVSHELKTPLTSIIGSIETLKEGAAENPRDRARFLDVIDEHSKNLRHLIEDLLLLSKVESGRENLRREKLDAEKILKKVIGTLDLDLNSKKIKVNLDFPEKPFLILADAKSIEQVFLNLIGNAIKYNEPGGKITVRGFYEADSAKIEFEDTGIGIPESDIPRIFERFYRVDKSRSRESGGTGLGLAIVKHIIERHSGQIHVKSHPQQGSTFTITLPRH